MNKTLSKSDVDSILKEKAWQHPPNYYGETWPGYTVLCGQNRDSDCLSRSNFESFKARMDFLFPGVVEIIRENHWLCGWVEWLGLPPDAPQEARQEAAAILSALEDYPVVNDEHFSEVESEEAREIWASCYTWRERAEYARENSSQFEPHSFVDLLACIRGKYFLGYPSELIG